MGTICTSTASVYVGTYHKYNCGSLKGRWFNLSDYENYADFHEALLKFHSDESDPELMAQDFEGIGNTTECGAFNRIKNIYSWVESGFNPDNEDEADAFFAFLDNNVCDEDTEAYQKYQDAFCGWWDSLKDYAEEQLEQMPDYTEASDFMKRHFNIESFTYELEIDGSIWYHEQRGRVAIFLNI